MKKTKTKLHRIFKKIHLVDKFLIITMLILMLETVFNLFYNGSQETNHIDIMVRTSAAAIFGYFISANFIRSSTKAEINKQNYRSEKLQQSNVSVSNTVIKNKIGFTTESKTNRLELPEQLILNSNEENEYHLQIMVVGVVGIVALLALLIFRNFCEQTPNAAGAISQLRDFVSGSVGFLIGCATGVSGDKAD